MTSAATGNVQDAVVSETHIAAPAEFIFRALVDPAQVPQWWGQHGIYRCTSFASDLRPGGQWRCSGVGPDGDPFDISGQYLEIDRPRLLVVSWKATWTGEIVTTVRWDLIPDANGTLTRITHSGFAAHPELTQAYRGWPRMLGWLQVFVEKRETIDSRPPA
jgi:uncharacterized protein YndB with AHSA1/START domain